MIGFGFGTVFTFAYNKYAEEYYHNGIANQNINGHKIGIIIHFNLFVINYKYSSTVPFLYLLYSFHWYISKFDLDFVIFVYLTTEEFPHININLPLHA